MDNDRAPSRSPSLQYLSKIIVRPPSISDSSKPTRRRIHLSPWDLRLLSAHYIQTGLLLPKPQSLPLHSIAARLKSSLSLTLRHFPPLAGRLATTHRHTPSPPSLSLAVDCNDEGAELIVAVSETVSAGDVLACRLLSSLFPLNGSICHEGHSLPLLSVQLTELKDAVYLACAMNHAVADGTSFWHFINSWSEISRAGPAGDCTAISRPPFLDRWFPEPLSAPLQLPFTDLLPMLRRYHPPPLSETFFHFSGKTIAELKAVANAEISSKDLRISSLQALLAHLWRSVARARNLAPEQGTAYFLAAGSRGRVEPPLPAAYFGNAVLVGAAKVSTRELAVEGLGRAAQRLNEAVAAQRDAYIREVLVAWAEKPSFVSFNDLGANNMLTGGSPRFEVFGNDFGWGRPLAVRSGPANKIDGTATAYPGCEGGSVGVQLCLSESAMRFLLDDEEFMATVCSY